MRVRSLPDLFGDSYAIIALLEGNSRYARIFRQKDVVTSAINVLEVYGTLLRRIEAAEARAIAKSLLTMVTPVTPEVAILAGEFRHSMRAQKRNCSYVDSWGYASAQFLTVPFLTGDPAFAGVENVTFVP